MRARCPCLDTRAHVHVHKHIHIFFVHMGTLISKAVTLVIQIPPFRLVFNPNIACKESGVQSISIVFPTPSAQANV